MLIELKIYHWGSKKQLQSNQEAAAGDQLVVQNNFGQFIATVARSKKDPAKKENDLKISGNEEGTEQPANGFGEEYLKVVRQATATDLKKAAGLEEQEKETLKTCREKIKQYNLPMKLVGAHYSLDGGSVIIAFISESRVDFRELVRDLSRTFQKAVRLEQIGSRDEARTRGGYGPCGRELCCIKFNGPLKSINTDMARIQQITHRGSERISGCCGRLLCCLAYELENYEELMKNLPETGQPVKVGRRRGRVRTLKVLQKKILIVFDEAEAGSGRRGDNRRNGHPGQEEKWVDLKDVQIIR